MKLGAAQHCASNEHNFDMTKDSKKILDSVPKTYRPNARLLLKYLFDKAVPSRISWDEHGVVTIDGSVIKDSNIEDLINEAMRERKTVKATGRLQFARLLRVLNVPAVLVRNKELLAASSSNIATFRPLRSSTPTETPRSSVDSQPAKKRRLLDWSKQK